MADSSSHHIHDSKRLKLEPWPPSVPLNQIQPQHHSPLQTINYDAGYPSDAYPGVSPYVESGPVDAVSPSSQSHMLPAQGMSGGYPGPNSRASSSQQHRGSIDDHNQQRTPHPAGLRPLTVPNHPPLHHGHPQTAGHSTPVSGSHMISPASVSTSTHMMGMGSPAGTPIGHGTPMQQQGRQGSIHHQPMPQDQAPPGMLGHFQLGIGQGHMDPSNATSSPVLNANMGMSLPMYAQQTVQGQIVTTYPPRRKAIRAAQACDACRARKAKCDEGRPSCGFCKESGVACVYREVPPPKQDRTLLQILDRLGRIEGLLTQQSGANGSTSPAGLSAPSGSSIKFEQGTSVPGAAQGDMALPQGNSVAPGVEPSTEDDEELNFPYQHTTAAHKLLLWPSIRTLVQEDCGESGINYVHSAEESRGSLQIWGKSETLGPASHSNPNTWFDEGNAPNMSLPGLNQGWNEPPTIPEEYRNEKMWDGEAGQDNGYNSIYSDLRDVQSHPGGLASDGVSLELDTEVIYKLLQSYLDNIHILHPILDKPTIREMARLFAAKVSPQRVGSLASKRQSIPNTVSSPSDNQAIHGSIGNRTNSPITGKRKRTASGSGPGLITSPTSTDSVPGRAPQQIPRTIYSAVVLLVCALGAVCLHRKPIPGPIIPAHGSSELGLRPSNRNSNLRNIDVIPGLAYFAKAAEIIGLQAGANELENVQAGLLAGLYWGQLGRVLDSWKWITWACMGCQVLVRLRLENEKNDLRKELMQRAFWSCQQLESDVLAELDLPPSGISRLEDSVPFPRGDSGFDTEGDGEDPNIFLYYLSQIALRKLLNRVHTELYKQRNRPIPVTRSLTIARELDYQLELWKSHLPEPLRWDESDPPSSDINAARLRAKYFGARYIIHRPFVYLRMHGNDAMIQSATSPQLSTMGSQTDSPVVQPNALALNTRKVSAVSNSPGEDPVENPHPLEEYCRKCLDAAVQSTRAFHAFSTKDYRPIITNVFGTAHAQFGNLLVLQAAHNSPQLRNLVDSNVLESLYSKTVDWLHTLAPVSPALCRDWIILRGVWHRNSQKAL